MKKIFLVMILAGCSLLLFYIGTAFATEPTNIGDLEFGIDGIKWGTNINELSGFTIHEDAGDGRKIYTRDVDDLLFGRVDLVLRFYGFENDKFCTYAIGVMGRSNVQVLNWTLMDIYGNPDRVIGGNRVWDFGDVRIQYSENNENVTLIFFYVPIVSGTS